MDLSNLQRIVNLLDLGKFSKISLVDGLELSTSHMPSFPPSMPALILGLENINFDSLYTVLEKVYDPETQIKIIDRSFDVKKIKLSDIVMNSGLVLFVPALGKGTSLESFQEIIAHLRAPEDGCPWDKEQTHLSLRKHLLEECYETISAMDEGNPEKMCEEFGDLLLQIILNAQIASESGEFTMTDVLEGIYEKIIRRHPHVFGEIEVSGVRDVLSNWEKIKDSERKHQGILDKGVLDGLPGALPALTLAQEYQDRASRVGFDWEEINGVLEKIKEEIEEVLEARSQAELMDEIGDLFFALVNLARWKKVDAEAALRGASNKFKKRFKYVESRAKDLDRSMQSMTNFELDDLWNEAKKKLRS